MSNLLKCYFQDTVPHKVTAGNTVTGQDGTHQGSKEQKWHSGVNSFPRFVFVGLFARFLNLAGQKILKLR